MGEWSGGSDMDKPAYSRLFVACGKQHNEEELREVFQEYGEIESLYLVRDSQTKEAKGIGYVKFTTTSSAAKAQENLDKTKLGSDPKPITVCIAASKTQQKSYDVNESSARNRLYITAPEGSTEKDFEKEFSRFDGYVSLHLMRNRPAGYATYSSPSAAAVAMESCSEIFRAVIAEPRATSQVPRQQGGGGGSGGGRPSSGGNAQHSQAVQPQYPQRMPLLGSVAGQMDYREAPACISVRCDNTLTQAQLKALLDIPPGLVACQALQSADKLETTAYAVYHTAQAAHYAQQKLTAFEYTPGSRFQIHFVANYDSTASPMGRDRKRKKSSSGTSNGHNEAGPPRRAFFICTPVSPPVPQLRSTFGRFGNLEKLWLIGDHNYGYAEFYDTTSMLLAISQLNGTGLGSCQLKVVIAEPRSGGGDSQSSKRGSQ